MPKNKPKLDARVKALREQLALGLDVAEFESVGDFKTFLTSVVKTQDNSSYGFIVTDKDGRKYEVKICPVDR